eukprot:CAMPEP_0201901730 /NCGR_PEP_ID=MMETSP0902-20130614/54588_1 /ASSEMBLY_ACC=CAM_ASM_000551 /TAXON_ID=420261 /ORGANISM="Thalassiosira antarctica, Strain CCMP982" /LENGTH=104 /DNA_ID=CAMNT_0048435701 /DNA_START=719 /DNA_END=1029 /DNA_ORIENTATION=-
MSHHSPACFPVNRKERIRRACDVAVSATAKLASTILPDRIGAMHFNIIISRLSAECFSGLFVREFLVLVVGSIFGKTGSGEGCAEVSQGQDDDECQKDKHNSPR